MIFISDEENVDRETPYVTYALVALLACGTVAAGLMFSNAAGLRTLESLSLSQTLGPGFGSMLLLAKIKALGSALASLQAFKLFSGIFVHTNFLSMLWFAMLLWVFGDNVEYAMGSARYTAFFFICGILTALIDALVTRTDPGIKIGFGPGGAVSAVAGAYAAYFPLARLKIEIHFGGRRNRSFLIGRRHHRSTSYVTAKGFIGAYFALNLICAVLLAGKSLGGLPYTSFPLWGQVAGFLIGYGLAFVFRDYNVLFTLDEEKQEYKLPPRKPKPAYDPFGPDTPAEPPKSDPPSQPPSF